MQKIYTKKEDLVENINEILVKDSYRWLEDGKSLEVKEWIENQNKNVYSVLKNSKFDVFSDELIKNFNFISFSNPTPVKGRYFFTERKPGEDQAVLYYKNGLDGDSKVIFNPNGKRDGNTLNIDYWNESRTGKYVAYGISKGGDEMATIYVKDIDNEEELSDVIENCRHSMIRWLDDDSGFYYTRNPKSGSVNKGEEHLYTKVYFHKLGENADNDKLIFGEGRPKDDMISLNLSLDGKYLAIQVGNKWTENDVFIYESETKKIKPFITGLHSNFSVCFIKDKVLIYTDYKANNFRIIWNNYDELYKPIDEWREFISERKYLLESFRVTKSKILVEYLENACSKLIEFDYNGKEVGEIVLPKYSNLAGISNNREEEEFFYGVDSFVFPKIIYRYDSKSSKYLEYKKIDNPINSNDFEVKQEWYKSKDGTSVPMFIFHKKGLELNSLNPTIFYGYGGFGNNETPSFMRNWIPWINRGGIFAIANIRGGGEFGDSWHEGGIKDKKQNSFDDFIAGAEYLISQKYTSSKQLGILGGSNGGLLVSAVGVQRPDLYKAICSKVPLTDMVRFPKFGIAVRWIHEYGNPDVKEDLEKIMTWSPYHNVKENIKYPNFLFTTAEKDTRVDPLHSRKMTAMLQNTNTENLVLLFTETDAGHGSGKPIKKIVENQAMVLTFFADELGLKVSD